MAQHIVADLVHETTTTTGTGNVTLAGAETARRAFADVMANNDTTFYAILHRTLDEYEIGMGTFVSATPAMARTIILSSSNSNNAVNFSAGTKDVLMTSPAIAQGFGSLTVTPSANQNNYNPTGLGFCNILNVNASASLAINGLAGGYEGRRMLIRNTSTDYLLIITHQNTNSTAANRFRLPNSFPAFLMPGDSMEFVYNGTSQRWEVISWPTMGMAMGLETYSDWVTSNSGIFATGQSGTNAGNQAGSYGVNTTERALGVGQIDTGTTSSGRALFGSNTVDAIVPTLGAALSVVRLAVETTVDGTETFTVTSGFIDNFGGTVNDGVYWENRWTGAAAEWSQTRVINTAATRSNTGSPTPDNNYLWLIVFMNPDWSRADFIYSTDSMEFTKADSPTTGIPGNTRITGWVIASINKSAGNTQRNVSVDLAGYRVDQARA